MAVTLAVVATAVATATSIALVATIHRIRGLRRRVDEVSGCVLGLLEVAAAYRCGTGEVVTRVGHAERAAVRAADTVTRAVETVRRLAASGDGVGNLAAYVGGMASLTDLLALNADIEATARAEAETLPDQVDDLLSGVGTGPPRADATITELIRETGQATGAVAAQVQAMREESGAVLHTLAALQSLVADIATSHAGMAAALENQTAATDRLLGLAEAVARAVPAAPGRGCVADTTRYAELMRAAGPVDSKAGQRRVQGRRAAQPAGYDRQMRATPPAA